MYVSTVPSEWATITRVSSSINGSSRARSLVRRSGSVAMIVTMSTVRSKAASPARLTNASMLAPGQRGQRLGDAGPRLLDPLILLGPGQPAEQVAVEADLDVAVVHAHPVMPQAVTHRRQPTRLQLVRTPQLVEGSMDQDDARHAGNLIAGADGPAGLRSLRIRRGSSGRGQQRVRSVPVAARRRHLAAPLRRARGGLRHRESRSSWWAHRTVSAARPSSWT